MTSNEIEVSVIMPCLNEEEAVGVCVKKCLEIFKKENIKGEIIVVDNGSADKSRDTASRAGAKVVLEERRGYGSAYLRGFLEAKGEYIVIGDSDDTYDFLAIPDFLKQLRGGYDFVIGSRLKGKIRGGNGTMPWLHRYIGNPFLTFILKKMFNINVSDAHCGMRGITRSGYSKLFLQTTGMEFASEMIINAGKAGLRMKEIPIEYRLRIGESKLRTFKDGWRHLRFMLLYSPTHLFLFPGSAMLVIGIFLLAILYSGPLKIGNLFFDYHYMFVGSVLFLLGYQVINLGFFSKIYSYTEKFEDEKNDNIVKFISKKIKLEHMILFGIIFFLIGLLILIDVVLIWIRNNFGELFEIRKMILSITMLLAGIQTIFFGFFYSILRIEKR